MEDHKTFADVSDKVVDKIGNGFSWMAEGVEKIVKTMSEQAPVAWNALVAYHRAVAISELVIALFFFIVGIGLTIFLCKNIRRYCAEAKERGEFSDSLVGKTVASGCVLFFVICGVMSISANLPTLVADSVVPERRAVMEVIDIIKKVKE